MQIRQLLQFLLNPRLFSIYSFALLLSGTQKIGIIGLQRVPTANGAPKVSLKIHVRSANANLISAQQRQYRSSHPANRVNQGSNGLLFHHLKTRPRGFP